jgi:leucyl aminopeptidase (aminopeptidase T)
MPGQLKTLARRLGLPALVLGNLVWVAGCGAGDAAESAPTSGAAITAGGYRPDLAATAGRVVRSVGVREGELVQIQGNPRDLDLLEELATEARGLGAHPLVTILTDEMQARSYEEVPERFDSVEPRWSRVLSEAIDVLITVDPAETLDVLSSVAPARVQARTKAVAFEGSLRASRNVRTIEIGNGLYPLAERAAQFGTTQEELAREFWEAVNADPAALAETGSRLESILRSNSRIHLTHVNGTDLRFDLDASRVFVNDGAVSPEEQSAGGTSLWNWLPAGEVFVRVRPSTGAGRIVLDRYWFQGQEVRGLTLDVAGGRITALSAQQGGEGLLAAYNSGSGDGREVLSILDLGINPALSAVPGSEMLTWVPAGMVTLVFGNDVWAGGSNLAPFTLQLFQPGTTLTAGETVVVEGGSLRP